MQNVRPADVEQADLADRLEEAISEDVLENGSPAQIVEQFLERRIDEIDALVSLLGVARKL